MKSGLVLSLAVLLTLTTYEQVEAIPVPVPQSGKRVKLDLDIKMKGLSEECKKNLDEVCNALPNVIEDDARLKELLEEHGCMALYKSLKKQVQDAYRKHQMGPGSCGA